MVEDIEKYLADDVQAWALRSDGAYSRVTAGDAPAVGAQALLLQRNTERTD